MTIPTIFTLRIVYSIAIVCLATLMIYLCWQPYFKKVPWYIFYDEIKGEFSFTTEHWRIEKYISDHPESQFLVVNKFNGDIVNCSPRLIEKNGVIWKNETSNQSVHDDQDQKDG